MATVEQSGLGKDTIYDSPYNPDLLFPISRQENRNRLRHPPEGYNGEDLWTCYELSWLSASGRPQVALAHFRVPSDSPFLIESKSFKLYLNSLNHHKMTSEAALTSLLQKDLSNAAGVEVVVELEALQSVSQAPGEKFQSYISVDKVEADNRPFVYEVDPSLLSCDTSNIVNEQLSSDLLRSNCPVTGQPDWGSLLIDYRGPSIDRESLLRYVVSFRQCQDFHEHCVEQIYADLMHHCQCESLSVYARYTRRGGLDINPYRVSSDRATKAPNLRLIRQ